MKELELFDYLAELDEIHGSRLEDGLQLTALWIRRNLIEVERLFAVFHPFFTLHDHQHSDAVVNHLYKIAKAVSLTDASTERALSRYETFYLLAAAYLHDLGMIVYLPGDDQRKESEGKSLSEIIRRDHHERSAQLVEKDKERFLLTPQDVKIIAALCRGHRIIPLGGPEYDNRHDERNRPIRVRLLAGLLRMADELDLAHKRAPEYQRLILEGGGQLDPIARRHWMKHYYTESVWFSREEEEGTLTAIKVNVDLLVPDTIHARQMRQEITQRLEQHLKSVSFFSEYGFNLVLGAIKDDPRPDLGLTSSVLRKQDVRILYVDDDQLDREEVASTLKKRGFLHCDTAPDSASALLKLSQVAGQPERQYHQIILDLHMRDLNGVESSRAGADVIPAFQKLCPSAQLMVFTGSSTDDQVGKAAAQEASKLGATVIHKDQGPDALAQKIEDALAQSYIIIESEPITEEGYPMSEKTYVPEKYRVLVVDDDPAWAKDCAEALTRSKLIDVDCVGGAKEAAAQLKKRRYHAAILDKNMPDLEGQESDHAGLDLLKYIQENYRDISCLILTSNPTFATYKEAKGLGMFDYKGKDEVGPEAIAETVLEMFRTRLVTVRPFSGHSVKADRMYFYGKPGVVVKEVSVETGEGVGSVQIGDEIWAATTKGTIQAVSIPAGTEVRAHEIEYGAILVTTGMY
jgi:DNA-binding NarL/FixJ family response regulator